MRLRCVVLSITGLLLLMPAQMHGQSHTANGYSTPSGVLGDAKRAFQHYANSTPCDNCGWTGATFLIGVMEYYKATVKAGAADETALGYAENWAKTYNYQICGGTTAGQHQQQETLEVRGNCSFIEGVVFDRGSNLNSYDVSSASECCAKCQSDPKCKSWNYKADENGICYTHPDVQKVIRETGSVAGVSDGPLPPLPPPSPPSPSHNGQHDADNQLCGATYIELYKQSQSHNMSMLADVAAVIDVEIAEGTASDGLWSWVDAIHMAMSTFSRMGNVTGDVKYFDKQFANFNASILARPGNGTYGFWNTTDRLYYRDDRFLGTQVYWGRGNGWAAAALVSALEFGVAKDPHYDVYLSIYTQHMARLKEIQYEDGAWRSSLLNVTAGGGACDWGKTPRTMCSPVPETTGTANFAYAMAWGINNGILSVEEYSSTVNKAWSWLSSQALHADGLVGYCQPGGGSPENNFDANSTNNFCVGQFLLAASQVSRMSQL